MCLRHRERPKLTGIRGSSSRGSGNGSGGGLDGGTVALGSIDDDGRSGGSKSGLDGGIVLHCCWYRGDGGCEAEWRAKGCMGVRKFA